MTHMSGVCPCVLVSSLTLSLRAPCVHSVVQSDLCSDAAAQPAPWPCALQRALQCARAASQQLQRTRLRIRTHFGSERNQAVLPATHGGYATTPGSIYASNPPSTTSPLAIQLGLNRLGSQPYPQLASHPLPHCNSPRHPRLRRQDSPHARLTRGSERFHPSTIHREESSAPALPITAAAEPQPQQTKSSDHNHGEGVRILRAAAIGRQVGRRDLGRAEGGAG
mmetsp:Transcript_45797/g.103181  ORF Transcript_45797/g.103181 Transcript_45797/m.103181 type:complete len:223 (-) Transcript_45797:917-1585(-)